MTKLCVLFWWKEESSESELSKSLGTCKSWTSLLEQFSIECRKTKTKVVTQSNHKGHRQSSEPIKTRSAGKLWANEPGLVLV